MSERACELGMEAQVHPPRDAVLPPSERRLSSAAGADEDPDVRRTAAPSRSPSPRPPAARYSKRGKLLRTFCACAAYFAVTLNIGVVGASLIDLELITGATTSEISLVFTCRGILAIVGSLVLGPLFDKVDNALIVSVSLFFDFVFCGAMPWCKTFSAVVGALSPPEFFNCAVGMGTHLICVSIWGDEAGPALQLLNLVAVIGFATAPLLAKPFLAPDPYRPESLGNISQDALHRSGANNQLTDGDTPAPYVTHAYSLNSSSAHAPVMDSTLTLIPYCYLLIACYSLLASALVFVMWLVNGHRVLLSSSTQSPEDHRSGKFDKAFVVKLCILFFLFNFFYAGIEIGYAGLVMAFAVKHLGWSKDMGANVIAVAQASNAIITALAIVLSNFVRPEVFLVADLAVVLVSLLALTLLVQIFPVALWACTALLGLGYATIMPSGFTWANNVIEVTGKFSSAYWCGYFAGVMGIPALAGYLFTNVNRMCFLYVMLTCGLGMSALFIATCITVRAYKLPYVADKI